MLRILIDARMLLGRFSGVPRVVTRLVDELSKRDGVRAVALCGNEPYEPWLDRRDVEVIKTCFTRGDRAPLRRRKWEETRLAHWIEQARCDVYHATWSSGIPPHCPIPTVLTIHDLIPWREPVGGLRSRFERWAYRRSVQQSARRATAVITVSEFVQNNVIDTLRISASNVVTIHNGADLSVCNRSANPGSNGPDQPYILYVGGSESRKNLETLFRALGEYGNRFDRDSRAFVSTSEPQASACATKLEPLRQSPLSLILTGAPTTLSAEARTSYESLACRDCVEFVGRPDDARLARLYENAIALVLPSRAEGFGLPAIEAMGCGCPVIAARAGSLPEIVGDAGVLVSSDDAVGFARAIHTVRTDEALRACLIETGRRRAALFTWHRAADAYLNLYERIAGARFRTSPVYPFRRGGPLAPGVSDPLVPGMTSG